MESNTLAKRKTSKIAVRNNLAGFGFISPPVIGFLLFTLIPLIFSLYVCFNSYDFFTGEWEFIGWANFKRALNDQLFVVSIQNTLFSLLGLGIQIIVALLLAVLLTVNIKGQPIFRGLFFIPSLCSSVAVTMVWKWLYNVDFGLLNTILGFIGIKPIGWLSDRKVAMISMIIQGVWMGVGGGMVMYIAALKNVPNDMYEAADIDGANSIQKFFKVTLPTISPTTFYILVTSFIGYMTDFTRFKMMTDGRPNYSTLTTGLYIYQTAFSSTYEFDYSYATTMSWMLGALIIALMGIIFATSKKWVHYRN